MLHYGRHLRYKPNPPKYNCQETLSLEQVLEIIHSLGGVTLSSQDVKDYLTPQISLSLPESDTKVNNSNNNCTRYSYSAVLGLLKQLKVQKVIDLTGFRSIEEIVEPLLHERTYLRHPVRVMRNNGLYFQRLT